MRYYLITLAVMVFFLCSSASAQVLEEYIIDPPLDVPDAQYLDASGHSHTLNSLKGKVVLLNFWATWCGPCVVEMPLLSRLAAAVEKDTNIVILPVSFDTGGPQVIQDFYRNHKITNLQVYQDSNASMFRVFRIQALPSTMIINPSGQVVAMIPGMIEWDSAEVVDYLRKLAK